MATATARLLELAFDPEVHTAEDPTGDRILDAALSLAAESGLRHLTMDDVSRRAGVGRMTVYRRFGTRSALIEALSVRECRRCLARIAQALAPTSGSDQRLVALFTTTVAVIREHPLLERLARVEPEALLAELTRNDSAIFQLVQEFLMGVISEGQDAGELIDVDPALLAELALRLGLSFVLMPRSVIPVEDDQATREAITAVVAPLLRRT